jgi:hypothetical protein
VVTEWTAYAMTTGESARTGASTVLLQESNGGECTGHDVTLDASADLADTHDADGVLEAAGWATVGGWS